ncbi:aspartate aminotransferase [Anaeramoeba flamelloides]|uniref:Aspartate aminotransferase n=1 Tax=Anaeramoeba flamelloides TaxID=1746091 RepID=A0ABQ8XZK0_9EUKA|nr:aspartate aminotransferase [Anaeramoeba flamelloides]
MLLTNISFPSTYKLLNNPLQRNLNWFENIKQLPKYPRFNLEKEFEKCALPNKIRAFGDTILDINNCPIEFEAFKQAKIQFKPSPVYKNYGPSGSQEFNTACEQLIFGNKSKIIKEKRFCSLQTLGGTGALYLAMNLLHDLFPDKKIYFPMPNRYIHQKLFAHISRNSPQCTPQCYIYTDQNNKLSMDGIKYSMKFAFENSIVLFQTCGHNPSGQDPSPKEWKEIADICVKKELFPVFESTYLGLASGDPISDSAPIRIFEESGLDFVHCLSFTNNLGLHSDRLGCLSILLNDSKTVEKVKSLIESKIISEYFSPPFQIANTVAQILNDQKLKDLWIKQLQKIHQRFNLIKKKIHQNLYLNQSSNKLQDIENTKGLFLPNRLTKQDAEELKRQGLFIGANSEISIAGLHENNINHFIKIMKSVL